LQLPYQSQMGSFLESMRGPDQGVKVAGARRNEALGIPSLTDGNTEDFSRASVLPSDLVLVLTGEFPSAPLLVSADRCRYDAHVTELESGGRGKKVVGTHHVPQVVVPIPFEEVREFVRHALRGTSLIDPVAQVFTGWVVFSPHLRFTRVDDNRTLIEIDVSSNRRGVQTFMFVQRRAEIDRFFVAIQDELDRRERWMPRQPAKSATAE
jgi:hypothetical protein